MMIPSTLIKLLLLYYSSSSCYPNYNAAEAFTATTRTTLSTHIQKNYPKIDVKNDASYWNSLCTRRRSSNYLSEDDTDDDDDDDNNNEEMSEEERESIRKFRAQMLSLEGLSGFVSSEDDDEDEDNNENENESSNNVSSNIPILTELKDEEGIDALIRFASSSKDDDKTSDGSASSLFSDSSSEEKEWAIPLSCNVGDEASILKKGVVLVANPAKFCTDFGGSNDNNLSSSSSPNTMNVNNMNPFARAFGAGMLGSGGVRQVSQSLLAKFGLTLPPPAEIGADRRADLLPVVILFDDSDGYVGSQGVLLNRRTGYLIGDLEQQKPPPLNEDGERDDDGNLRMGPSKVQEDETYLPKLGAFMIQPLWFGGTSSGGISSGSANGLDMLHRCEDLRGSLRLTDDGLFWGGDPVEAQDVMYNYNKQNPSNVISGFDFKFFVQSTKWLPTQLEKEVRDGTWFVANVSRTVLFKSRDRLGTRRGKPLWTEIMELMGLDYKDIRDELYKDE